MSEIDQREAELYELKDRLWGAERKLEDLGYRHCDIAACNCNSYHRWSASPEVVNLRQENERLRGEVMALTKENAKLQTAWLNASPPRRPDSANLKSALESRDKALAECREALRCLVLGPDNASEIEKYQWLVKGNVALTTINTILGKDK